jgi:transcriptional regulator with XRE-family HTH domain
MPHENPTSVLSIAGRLTALREELGLNQAEICRLTGVEPNTWNQWEKAKGRPELDKALLVCGATGVTLDWIYRGNPAGLPYDLAQKLIIHNKAHAS